MHMRMCEYVPAQARVHALMFKAECCYAVLADLEFADPTTMLGFPDLVSRKQALEQRRLLAAGQ